jgi:hypothetical protein
VILSVIMVVALGATMLIGVGTASAGSGTAGPATISVTPDTGLVNLSVVTVNATGFTNQTGQMNIHICEHGNTYANNTEFALGAKCAPSATSVGADATKTVAVGPADTSETATFKVGVGTVSWSDSVDSTARSVNCSSGSVNCDMVVEFNVAGGPYFYVQPLTFSGQPGAPTGVAIAAPGANGDGLGAVNLTWNPGNANGGTVDQYWITATNTGGAADPSCVTMCTFTQAPVGGNVGQQATTINLHNFTNYSVTVATHISQAVASPYSAESTPAVLPTPTAGAPGAVFGQPKHSQVDLTWAPPAYTTGLVGYVVTATSGGGTQCTTNTGNPVNYSFTGLTDGTSYTFTVQAFYGGTCGAPQFLGAASSSAALVPTGIEVDQIVSVDRPQGALVLTQACDTRFSGNPYPVDSVGVPLSPSSLYATPQSQTGTGGPLDATYNPTGAFPPVAGNCTIDLGHASFVVAAGSPGTGYPSVGEGQFFKADGTLSTVAVVDTRDTDAGWTVTGLMKTDFYASASKHFSAHQLGWQPGLLDKSAAFATPDGSYANGAAAGAAVLPANHAADTALGSPRTLGSAPATQGLGIAHLNAQLHMLIPVFAQHGVYSAVMQITAV